jgi:SpoIIAA-like
MPSCCRVAAQPLRSSRHPVHEEFTPSYLDEINAMIEQLPTGSDQFLSFRLSGLLHHDDYKAFVPVIDAAIAQEGRVRLLAQFEDFRGWDAHALWDDIKFSTTHCTKMERIALVGDRRWEAFMAKVCKPFTIAWIKYFNSSEIEAARAWIAEG